MTTRDRSRSAFALTGAAILAASSAAAALLIYRSQRQQKLQDNENAENDKDTADSNDKAPLRQIEVLKTTDNNALHRVLKRNSITIVHGSVTGMCRQMAQDLHTTLQNELPSAVPIQMAAIPEFDWWDELINDDNDDDNNGDLPLLLVLLPTYASGTWTPPSQPLQDALQELDTDWRIAQRPLQGKLRVGVLGVGSSEYDVEETNSTSNKKNPTMGRPARHAVRQLQQLGAKPMVRLQVGDAAVGNHAWDTYRAWTQALLKQLQGTTTQKQKQTQKQSSRLRTRTANKKENNDNDACACTSDTTNQQDTTSGCCQQPPQSDNPQLEDENDGDGDNTDDDNDSDFDQAEPDVMDLEDMGDALLAAAQQPPTTTEPREMVTPSQAAALKKEGYKLIGTHSAVKLCRWTKHQLRGRGGCYKHTFYGITSYQCMEATPSLACANKCVFCWRHHKNPVGKEWRWKTDEPDFIVEQAVQTHVGMIKEARGIPGVRLDRWQQAHTVRHCALSLVGEPIMYPRINELLGELHHRHISTFLVTNGQHPAAISTLIPITQLYVSVDAPTRTSLIEIDRPLFNDAWERLQESLVSLKHKGQRTVARLTVVKGWNSGDIQGYAELIALGRVGLVEVKGVTYCGKSDASNLNMSNTPWHHEVVALTQQLEQELQALRARQLAEGVEDVLPEYGLACEHKHSCSVLLARVDQFSERLPNGERQWKTWIDYDKFQALAARCEQDPAFTFGVQDYTADTPRWALFGANEEGFDPTETRHRKTTKHPKYTQFDDRGIPTHDENGQPLSNAERARLSKLMEDRIAELGTAESVVTELRDGAKEIEDPSLMFRGLVVTKT